MNKTPYFPFALIILLGLSGCEPAPPSEREVALEKANSALAAKLNEALAKLNRAEVEAGAAKIEVETLGRKLADLKALTEEHAKEDLEYLVIRKEYIEGQLAETGPYDPVTKKQTLQRVNPRWLVYFQGKQTHREYPGIEMLEAPYRKFIEGAIYTRDDINRAKK